VSPFSGKLQGFAGLARDNMPPFLPVSRIHPCLLRKRKPEERPLASTDPMSIPVGHEPARGPWCDALRFLYQRIDYERLTSVPYRKREFKLDRMRELLARLDNPHRGLPIVHVAGTKGKGSTAAMLGAVLSAEGYAAGIYTSPHLDRLEERMAINGEPCSRQELVDLVERVTPIVERMDREAEGKGEFGPTYFEIITAMALVHFAQRGVDFAVLEVGLGGRLDSTNVCRPRVSAITSISYDHTRQLGNTLESIAWEKAGIVKRGVPLISGVCAEPAKEVIREACRRRGAPIRELGADFDFQYYPARGLESAPSKPKLDFRFTNHRETCFEGLALGLLGRHQAANAAVVLAALSELHEAGYPMSEAAIRQGLAELQWPARIEVLGRRPAVVVDAAHNIASVDALLEVFNESFSANTRLLVFATTQEKDARGMIARLASHFDQLIFTRYLNNPRSVPPEELEKIAAELTGQRHLVCAEPQEAWKVVRQRAGPDDLICITGSVFIAAEMRREILGSPQ
jgi:dihydrofolate synthase/folylpolyglutamate synthase